MQTDELIHALAADRATAVVSPVRIFAIAMAISGVISVAAFAFALGPRIGFAQVLADPGVLLKFALPLILGFAAGGLVLRLMRPEAAASYWLPALAVAPVLLALAVAFELITVAPVEWRGRLVGVDRWTCLVSVPLLALPFLISALYALRHGAPTRRRLVGAAAGLLAGALGATVYASYCVNDSALYLATWYGLAILIVTVVGVLLGPRVLRW